MIFITYSFLTKTVSEGTNICIWNNFSLHLDSEIQADIAFLQAEIKAEIVFLRLQKSVYFNTEKGYQARLSNTPRKN